MTRLARAFCLLRNNKTPPRGRHEASAFKTMLNRRRIKKPQNSLKGHLGGTLARGAERRVGHNADAPKTTQIPATMPNATAQRADGSSARIGLIEKANRAQPIAAAAN